PLVQRTYDGDAAAQDAALRMLSGLREWLEASRNYRHQPGTLADPAQPPADLAILAISHGAALLRWLAGVDEAGAAWIAVIPGRATTWWRGPGIHSHRPGIMDSGLAG